jgi:hypothetical protein
MSRRFTPIVVPAVVAVLAAAVAFSTSSAQGPTCSSIYTYRAVETPLRVSSDLTVRLRNPYGAVVNIGRFFVQVRIVYASDADRAKVASVQRALDGQPNRWKRGGDRDAHLFAFFHLGEGPHVIDVTITPTGGTPVTGHIAFIATRCEPKSFAAEAEHRKAPGHQPFAFWVYAGSTPMRQIDIARASARISTPRLRCAAGRSASCGSAPPPTAPLRCACYPGGAIRMPSRCCGMEPCASCSIPAADGS